MEFVYSLGLVLAGFLIATLRNSISNGKLNQTYPSQIQPASYLHKKSFLDQHLFYDLADLNTGFDAEAIRYFSKDDFEKVLDRVEFFNIRIMGIETWVDGKFSDVEVYEDYNLDAADSKWYRSAFKKLLKRGKANQVSASYDVPVEVLKLFAD